MSSKPSAPPAEGRFFIIGAQRSGTTYLYDLLDGHPQVAMAKPKKPEPKWFLHPEKAGRGAEDWKKALFKESSGRLLGEKGTSYIEHPEAAASILRVFPEAQFVVILREPVSRAISNYRFSVDNGLETLPLEKALSLESEKRPYDSARMSASPFIYLKRGLYAHYLEPWLKAAPQGRLHAVLFEELVSGEKAFDALCRFLGIEPYQPEALGRIVNAAQEPLPEIPGELRSRLKDYFREPNRQLAGLLQRGLEAWDG